ncbi:hypothetical protein QC762_100390 [Podospora pseudocomata]|uniref:protein-ribulosamine 3-kinase n=1 Tax=Podospora pseudocomata TaxID=2093779 RepID=A0ABR0GR89_9PEZI|nr:hypothetical protein QC762_100390 [Podospora pseudocomata]
MESEAFVRGDEGAVFQLDRAVLDVLPNVAEIVNVSHHGESAWAKALRVDTLTTNGNKESYFMKVSVGTHGREALGTSAIFAITPDFCPLPIAWGSLKTQEDSHFYLCKFYDFTDGVPEPVSFCEKLARLYSSGSSPEGKFGFHCTTYNGDLPQDSTWHNSWEQSFANGLRNVLQVRKDRAGPHDELDSLLPDLFDKVIPRLLPPLETSGRTIIPSLVHGDLWCGNASIVNEETEEGIVYDPAAFWAHYEYELGNWRPARNQFTRLYFDEYHSHVPKAEPAEDYDSRNALYALRFDLHAAALFSTQEEYVQMAIDEIQRLVEKFHDGITKGTE